MNTQIISAFWRFGAVAAFLLCFASSAHALEYGILGAEYTSRMTGNTVTTLYSGGNMYTNPETTIMLYAVGEVGSKIQVFEGSTLLGESSAFLTETDTIDVAGNPYIGQHFYVTLSAGTHTISSRIVNTAGMTIKNYTPVGILVDLTSPPPIPQYGIKAVEYTNRSTNLPQSKATGANTTYINPSSTVTLLALGEVGTKIRVKKGAALLAESSDLMVGTDSFSFGGDIYTGESFSITLPVGTNALFTEIVDENGVVIKTYDPVNILIDTTDPLVTVTNRASSQNYQPWVNTGLNRLYANVTDTGSGWDTNLSTISYSLYDKTTNTLLNRAGDVVSISGSEVRLAPQGGFSTGTFVDGREYYVEFTVADRAGNTRTARHDFTVDYTAPTVVSSPANLGNDVRIIGYYDPNHPNCSTDSQCQLGGTLPGYMPYSYSDPENTNILYTNPTYFAVQIQNGNYSAWQSGNSVSLADENRLAYDKARSYSYNTSLGGGWIGSVNPAIPSYTSFSWVDQPNLIFRTRSVSRYAGTTRESWRWRDSAYNIMTGYGFLTADPSLNLQEPPIPPPSPTITSPTTLPNQSQNSRIPAPHGGEKWNLLDDGNRLLPDFSGTVSLDPIRNQIVQLVGSGSIGVIGQVTVPAGQTSWTIPNASLKTIGNDYYYDIYARVMYTNGTVWSNSFNLRIWTDFYRPTFLSSNAQSDPLFHTGVREVVTFLAQDNPHPSTGYETSFGTWRLDGTASQVTIYDIHDQVMSGLPAVSWVSNSNGTYTGSLSVNTLPTGRYRAEIRLVDNYGNENASNTNINFIVDNSSPVIEPLKGDGTALENGDEIANVSEITLRVADISGVDTAVGRTSFRLYKNVAGIWQQIPISGIASHDMGEDVYEVTSGAYVVEKRSFQLRATVMDNVGNQSEEIVRTFTVVPDIFSFEHPVVRMMPNLSQIELSQPILQGAIPLSGQYEVTAKWEGDSNLDEIILFDQNNQPVVLTSGTINPTTLFPAFDFGVNTGVLSLKIQTPASQYGSGILSVVIRVGSGILGTMRIDTRQFGGITNTRVNERYALDPLGQLIDVKPGDGRGMVISGPDSNKNITANGVIWSKVFGWIHLQPCSDGTPGINCNNDPEIRKTLDLSSGCGSEVCVRMVSENRANLEGYGWSEKAGWINFGNINGTGGIYIDDDGYFHGSAWSEKFGSFVMGDSMLAYVRALSSLIPGFSPPLESDIREKGTLWARTDWQFPNNNPPTAFLVSPPNDPYLTSDRRPTLTFHIQEADEDKVGYSIIISRQNPDLTWRALAPRDQEATLDPNLEGENMIYGFSEDLEPGRYRWSVVAFDEIGTYAEETPAWEFIIENNPPVASLTSPPNGSSSTKRPTLGFNISDPDGDLMRWRVQMATDSSFSNASLLPQSSAFSSLVSGGDFSYSPPGFLPSGTVYWRVVVEDKYNAQNQAPIPFWTLNVQNTAPDISSIRLLDSSNIEIQNGEQTADARPRISWRTDDTDSSEITTTLEVRRASDNVLVWTFEENHEANTTTQRTVSSLSACASGETDFTNCEYTYRLQSCDEGSCSEWEPIGKTFIVIATNRYGNIGTARIASMIPSRMTFGDLDSSNNKNAWNKTAGWIDFNPMGGGVVVANGSLQGYAWSDSLGWIRMNCGEFDNIPSIVGETDECATYDYGIANDGVGMLSGKIRIENIRNESTGKYLYFDEQSLVDDGGSPSSDPIQVNISCEAGTQGHFEGQAWSNDMGWVAFGKDEIVDYGKGDISSAQASDYFPITEWACNNDLAPVLNSEESRYFIFSAQDTVPYSEIWVVQQYIDEMGQNSGKICNADGSPINANIVVEKISADGTDTTTLNTNYYSLRCEQEKLWIDLENSMNDAITKTPGLYRITGRVTDENDAFVDLPVNTETPHIFDEEFIVQVVAADPDFDATPSPFWTITKHREDGSEILIDATDTDGVIADGEDYYRVCFNLRDQFGNPIVESRKYEALPGDPVCENDPNCLKKVDFGFYISESVNSNQVQQTHTLEQGIVRYSPLSVHTGYADDSYYSHQKELRQENPIVDQGFSEFCVDITSLAPTSGTDDSNFLAFWKTFSTISARTEYSGVGETMNNGVGEEVQGLVNQIISFLPLVSVAIDNFNEFVNSGENITITLTNKSDTVDIVNFDWIGIFRTLLGSTNEDAANGSSFFREILLKDPNDPTTYMTLEARDHFQEVSGANGALTEMEFMRGSPTLFPSVIVGTDIEEEDKVINDRLFPFSGLSAGGSLIFELTAESEFAPNTTGEEEYPEFLQYFALSLGGEIIRFPLLRAVSSIPMLERQISITGQTHGENINKEVIINSGGDGEFTQMGNIYTRQQIRRIMRENYDRITGSFRAQKQLQDPNENEYRIEDWTDLQSELNSGISYRSLQDKKVLWFLRPDGKSEPFTLTLGDSDSGITIPENQGAMTIFVEGGNVLIKNNITIGQGSNLGIVVFSGRQYSKEGTEGNIYINNSVNRIEGVYFAEGAVMSTKDNGDERISEGEILDGFAPESGEYQMSDFNNQLYIKGSIVSQNTVGQSSEGMFPVMRFLPSDCDPIARIGNASRCDNVIVREIQVPDECSLPRQDGGLDNRCNDLTTENAIEEQKRKTMRKKASQRYDFLYLRRYGTQKILEVDGDGDGISDQKDCFDNLATPPPAPLLPTDTSLDGGLCSLCQDITGNATGDPACILETTGYKTSGTGTCAEGTLWCDTGNPFITESGGQYTYACTVDTDNTDEYIPFCDENGNITNNKIGAAVIFEYDPRVKTITPPGMNVQATLDIDKSIN